MFERYKAELIRASLMFTEKEKNKYGVEQLIKLSEKLVPCTDRDLIDAYDSIIVLIENRDYKHFKRVYNKLISTVSKRYGYHTKNEIITEYTGIGVALGTGIGVALASITSGGIGIGVAIGVGFGALVGNWKAKSLESEDKLY